MRLRLAMLGIVLSAVALVATPSLANAAPQHNHGLTIAVTENPILSGESLVIYGQLHGTNVNHQTIVLYHHIGGSRRGYTRIQSTTTNSLGYYAFNRADGVVTTNRSWFVRLSGHPGTHSRTVHERVYALVGLSASNTNPDTLHKVRFFGHVSPNHRGNRVELQRSVGGDDWRDVKSGRTRPALQLLHHVPLRDSGSARAARRAPLGRTQHPQRFRPGDGDDPAG